MVDKPYVEGSPASEYKWHEVQEPESFDRIYTYLGGEQLSFEGVRWVYAKANGGHRLVTQDGESIYVMPGWISVQWKGKFQF